MIVFNHSAGTCWLGRAPRRTGEYRVPYLYTYTYTHTPNILFDASAIPSASSVLCSRHERTRVYFICCLACALWASRRRRRCRLCVQGTRNGAHFGFRSRPRSLLFSCGRCQCAQSKLIINHQVIPCVPARDIEKTVGGISVVLSVQFKL